jgi:hypothetical protein
MHKLAYPHLLPLPLGIGHQLLVFKIEFEFESDSDYFLNLRDDRSDTGNIVSKLIINRGVNQKISLLTLYRYTLFKRSLINNYFILFMYYNKITYSTLIRVLYTTR